MSAGSTKRRLPTMPEAHEAPLAVDGLMDEVVALRMTVAEAAASLLEHLGAGADDAALANLAHYLALRHHDLRALAATIDVARALFAWAARKPRSPDARRRRRRALPRSPASRVRSPRRRRASFSPARCGSSQRRMSSSARSRRTGARASWSRFRARRQAIRRLSSISRGAAWTSRASTVRMTTTSPGGR